MSESIQNVLGRNRPPRVQITYNVHIGDAVEAKELPFVVGVMSDLSAHFQEKDKLSERKFVEISRDNFDDVLASTNSLLKIKVPNVIDDKKDISISIKFKSIEHFHPSYLLKNIPVMASLYETRTRINDLCAIIDNNDVFYEALRDCVKSKSIDKIDEIVSNASLSVSEERIENIKRSLSEINEYLSKETGDTVSDDPFTYLSSIVVKIDKSLSAQMDLVLHNPDFQNLEGEVRSLHYLVMNTETSEWLKIRFLNVSKDELFKDLEKAADFDQSVIFKKVYEEEYGTFGGNPYSCLVGGYSFGKNSRDVAMLRKLSGVAAAAHAPFIGALSPEIFDMTDFANIESPRDLKVLCGSSEFINWNSLRSTEDSRYLSLVMPRILIRQVYGTNFDEIDEFSYEEGVNGDKNHDFCWGNPAFVIASRITSAFAKFGWTAAIRGYEGGGAIENLPVYTYKTSSGDIGMKCPAEVNLTDRREKELEELGFLSICHRIGTSTAAIFSAQTIHKPKKYDKEDATANAMLSCRLPYILNVSRFAHYIKVIMRDKVGSFTSAEDVRVYLQNWLSKYVLLSDLSTQETKSRFPLREGRVDVKDDPENPGSYKAVMFLRPHFQMEDLTVSLRLVAKLPKPAGN